MCLSIPAEIISIEENDLALVSVGGTHYKASLKLVDDVLKGDFILLHSGYAIGKIDKDRAVETLKLMETIKRKADANDDR
ncbi:MAG: HypC/HybG/HupF family hydrogenase formation chaperone [Spirochaetaceae bacterium]|nr:HypC/HybG/HupF family hydrogenase formation chaperone [Spirochaetaceae bacterium]